ncbi:MAG: TIGR01212 family radical SAM protein [Calditrichia bacterium]|nr:TIGR01212 family radical SAM protein [Calditrichia bacterium]
MADKKNNFPWGNALPYNSYREYIKQKFGERVQKVSVDPGFTCPNRDGTKGVGGCIYCNNSSFTPNYVNDFDTIYAQIEEGVEFLRRRYGARKFIAYFQASSNTYAPLDVLQKIYEKALSHPDVIGLAIGTRPDCVDEEKISYIKELAKEYYVSVEYGLESAYDKILENINRCHSVADFEKAVYMTAGKGIYITTHLILGLPGETDEMLMKTAEYISKLPIDYLKLHHLHVVKGTTLAKQYSEKKFKVYSLNEYIKLVAEFLRRVRPDIIMQRVVGETNPVRLIAPKWGIRANILAQMIEEYMLENGFYQGELWKDEG